MPRCSIRVFDTHHLAATGAGDAFMDNVYEFSERLAGVVAGRTMQPVYDHLVSAEARSSRLFSKTTFVQIGEVVSAVSGNTSFSDEIERHLLSRLSGGYRTFLVINGQAKQPDLEPNRHRAAILENGGLGAQLLSIGVNDHVGFTEPECEPDSRCRVTELAMNALERNGYPPWHARDQPWHRGDHVRAENYYCGPKCGQINRRNGNDRRTTARNLLSQPSSGISQFDAAA